jgi:hypothetical protein
MVLLNLAQEKGLNPKFVANTADGEYHSPCPACGGRDRFVIQPNKQMKNCMGSYFCRQCDIKGDSIQFCRDHLGYSFSDAMDRVGAQISENKPRIFIQKKSYLPAVTALVKPSGDWTQSARALVDASHEKILFRKDILDSLNKRGLSLNAIQQYRIGWIEHSDKVEGHLWGAEKEAVWLPAGILIPTIEQDQSIIRLKIRRNDWKPNDERSKYVAVTGSMKGLNIIGDKKNPVMIVVESELDAYALHYAVGDFATIVAVGGGMKDIDSTTNYLAQKKTTLLICHDNDEVGNKMFNKWLTNYPHAKSYPTIIGKDIGEAVEQGLKVRDWIIDALPHELKCSLRLIWSNEDQALIDWILHYINERTITRSSYDIFEREINLGPNSPRARTGELQKGLRLMKQMIEDECKKIEV